MKFSKDQKQKQTKSSLTKVNVAGNKKRNAVLQKQHWVNYTI